jgi:TRAP transporter TAXI family solute receptor
MLSKYIDRPALLAVGLSLVISPQALGEPLMTIGTGDSKGVYYGVGGAICRLVDNERQQHGIRCVIRSTGGSVANLQALRERALELAIVQADWQYHAFAGTSEFKDAGSFDTLRTAFSLYAESFTIVAHADVGVKTFDDLRGKRVNIGNPGSGQRATMELLVRAKGWTLEDFGTTLELTPGDQAEALCNRQVDAIVFMVGHPNGSIFDATTTCDSTLVTVASATIEKLVEETPYYTPTIIPGGMYRGNRNDVTTFGVRALVATTSNTPEPLVYTTVKAVFENLDEFRRSHPVLNNLSRRAMVTDGAGVPLSAGAERYFRETKLLD